MRETLIHRIYKIVIYLFPILILFLLIVGFQLRKLEENKKDIITRLRNSMVVIETSQNELISLEKRLLSLNDSLIKRAILASKMQKPPSSVPEVISSKSLLELRKNVLKRVDKLKVNTADYYNKPYVVKKPTGRYYTIIISYSELGYAIIQREHLKSLGFTNVKILMTGKLYALSIEDASEESDYRLHQALDKWNANFKSESDACIIKF